MSEIDQLKLGVQERAKHIAHLINEVEPDFRGNLLDLVSVELGKDHELHPMFFRIAREYGYAFKL